MQQTASIYLSPFRLSCHTAFDSVKMRVSLERQEHDEMIIMWDQIFLIIVRNYFNFYDHNEEPNFYEWILVNLYYAVHISAFL